MYWVRTYSAWWICGLALAAIGSLYARGTLAFPVAASGFGLLAGLLAYARVARQRAKSAGESPTPELVYVFAPF